MSDTDVPRDRPVRPGEGRGGGAGDVGLFGPDSVTWRLHAEPLMGVALARSLLLQALHPVAMTAFEDHGTLRRDVWSRIARTAEYVTVTTFGSTTEAMMAASMVRAVHAQVRGVVPGGAEYAADDPQLLGWVHCCLVASFLEVLTRGGVALTGPEQDQYIAEQVKAAMLVGLEPDEVPHDRAALLDYFRVIKPALEGSPGARSTALELVTPPAPVLVHRAAPQRPAWADVAGLAYAALPPWARRLYGLTDVTGAAALPDAAATVGLRTLRASLLALRSTTPVVVDAGAGAELGPRRSGPQR
ncbi:MAG TPA: oxygenase MpaB family protein [Kineosporiaceae bacterium]|nr:oxygenase MpaB family protein [Kineosporiaceae bacterium]